ncbi:hypothetical protein PF005_g13766 [Phytophthora fragariae]|uniref:Uncharacterized protein n=2 Tax=Phytophthora TaxID=4783 RepID=A0A6A4DEP1_9STRA|nr:hypothetical protein PF003_g28997 [Phytophthora fragariae]KAE9027641.1 hypothetical protein PR002_g10626 [Phytophthora rubi]KAE8887034.1 hypothetical protein PF003_g29000 [Phytophthora fragariae]KAE8934952.1 hypothetical protein PF009_g15080 [Phytophthora fragariae]KAE9033084.1 hypothetical protein PR001_g10312 [Phytophthora rubi]
MASVCNVATLAALLQVQPVHVHVLQVPARTDREHRISPSDKHRGRRTEWNQRTHTVELPAVQTSSVAGRPTRKQAPAGLHTPRCRRARG